MLKKIIIFSLLTLSLFVFILTPALALEEKVTETKATELKLAVPIGNLVSFKVTCTTGVDCPIDWLAQYISAIFRIGVGIAAILAVIMMMVAGFLWLTSAGNPGQITKAKDFISSSLLGLFLALFSYVILNTINPELMTLKALSIRGVEKINLSDDSPTTNSFSNLMASSWQETTAKASYVVTPHGTVITTGPTISELKFQSGETFTRPVSGEITRGFTGTQSADHRGVDFQAGLGDAVSASASGVVKYTNDPRGGTGIMVYHGKADDGYYYATYYGHLGEKSLRFEDGARVSQGDWIADVGTTGRTTGPHLHFAVLRTRNTDGSNLEYIDPATFSLPRIP